MVEVVKDLSKRHPGPGLQRPKNRKKTRRLVLDIGCREGKFSAHESPRLLANLTKSRGFLGKMHLLYAHSKPFPVRAGLGSARSARSAQ